MPDMKHWPEYEMQSAPCTNDLEAELGHGRVDGADVVERVLAREHDAVDAELRA